MRTGFLIVLALTGVSFVGVEFQYRRGMPGGYAPLDANSRVPVANLGSGAAGASDVLHGDHSWSPAGGGGGLPAGAVILVTSGSCPAGFAEAPDLNGVMIRGTTVANGDVGTTGGSDTVTPAGTNSAPTFAGAVLGTHLHGVGSYVNGAVSAGTPIGSNTWPAGVPTASNGAVDAHSGTAVADHASHTHTYNQVISHVHGQNVNTGTTGGQVGYGVDTSTNGSGATGLSTASTGVATGTTAGPSAVLTHSVTQPANHVFTQPAITWPAGVPIFTGTVLPTHNHTITGSGEAISAGTPAGTITAPAFSGVSQENRPAFIRVIFCRKT